MKTVSLDKVAGAPREFEVAGTTYKMNPVNVNILASVEQWAREQPFVRLNMKLEKVGKNLPDSIIEKWADEASAASEMADNVQKELESIAGVKKILRCCFNEAQPVTEEEFETILSTIGLEALRTFLEKDNHVPGIDDVEAPEGTTKK